MAAATVLEFERPIADLEKQIEEFLIALQEAVDGPPEGSASSGGATGASGPSNSGFSRLSSSARTNKVG